MTKVSDRLVERARQRLPEWMRPWARVGLEWLHGHYLGVVDEADHFLIDEQEIRGVYNAARSFAEDMGPTFQLEVAERGVSEATVARYLNELTRAYSGERIRAEHTRSSGSHGPPAGEPMYEAEETRPAPPAADEEVATVRREELQQLAAALGEAAKQLAAVADRLAEMAEEEAG